jgi:hypothetical protein
VRSHAADLTAQERAENIARWVALTGEKMQPAQVAPVSKGGRTPDGKPNQGGINAAVRDLGIDRTEAGFAYSHVWHTTPLSHFPPLALPELRSCASALAQPSRASASTCADQEKAPPSGAGLSRARLLTGVLGKPASAFYLGAGRESIRAGRERWSGCGGAAVEMRAAA